MERGAAVERICSFCIHQGPKAELAATSCCGGIGRRLRLKIFGRKKTTLFLTSKLKTSQNHAAVAESADASDLKFLAERNEHFF